MSQFKPGDHVAWKWGFGVAEGVVVQIVPEPTKIESKGKWITRNGSEENPAVIIEHTNGNPVIKLESELLKTV